MFGSSTQRLHSVSVGQNALVIRIRSLNATLRTAQLGSTTHLRDVMLNNAVQYYDQVWSSGRVTLLDAIMAEDHEQHDVVWQPGRVGAGRRVMKRGILAYRAAYPDLRFRVLQASFCDGDEVAAGGPGPVCGGEEGSQGDSQDSSGATCTPSVFVRWHATGTNLGPIREQAPTGKAVSFSGVSHLLFDVHGKIQASYVFRQTPEDERTYFMGQAAQGS